MAEFSCMFISEKQLNSAGIHQPLKQSPHLLHFHLLSFISPHLCIQPVITFLNLLHCPHSVTHCPDSISKINTNLPTSDVLWTFMISAKSKFPAIMAT